MRIGPALLLVVTPAPIADPCLRLWTCSVGPLAAVAFKFAMLLLVVPDLGIWDGR
jgi:hypothetical protein